LIEVSINNHKEEIYVFGGRGVIGKPVIVKSDGLSLAVSYGAKYFELPFRIKLYDFIMERNPGTNSAASYASEVQLIDDRHSLKKDYRIYMNNILNYGGYRFFQSSYDRDEKGTYLSVNQDFWGTWISYLGYALLTLGFLLLLFSKKTRFYQLSRKIAKLRSGSVTLLLFVLLSGFALKVNAQEVIQPNIQAVSAEHAARFSRIIVQDFNGRFKPIHTLTRELMRKVARKESYHGLNADRVILSMFADKQNWYGIPLIKVGSNKEIREKLGIGGDYAAYRDFFFRDGSYKLNDEISQAMNTQPADRGIYEKLLLKIDERVNIMNMIFTGRVFRIIPLVDDENNTWVSAHQHGNDGESSVAERFFSEYHEALQHALHANDYSLPNKILAELSVYQMEHGTDIMPSASKVNAEILLNNLHVFNRLALFYAVLGLVFLALLFISVFNPILNLRVLINICFGLVAIGFLFHTLGLGIRWYVSGRAPWSNGYESMIYIAWTTTLAGLVFTRKSIGGMAATMVLAATILLIAMLSYLDPQITPLVPVLRSYWLTIHVSLEAGSYGFLMLGAIIGLINLILMIFLTQKNKGHIQRIVKEMSYISEMTIIGGLIMLSIGTYLGGVWANESWGRYWGWDAKETWALVTILVYAFILHMRIIPKMSGLYTYNLATVFGLSSVVMTYYGVNYYLSGLHSYAAGDPVPVPAWVYISIATVTVICLLALWRKRRVVGKTFV
jgi:cytochrome c-type biogenesis protein CcsB